MSGRTVTEALETGYDYKLTVITRSTAGHGRSIELQNDHQHSVTDTILVGV